MSSRFTCVCAAVLVCALPAAADTVSLSDIDSLFTTASDVTTAPGTADAATGVDESSSIDDIFGDSTDVQGAVKSEQPATGIQKVVQQAGFMLPFRLTGYFESEIGAGLVYQNKQITPGGTFSFKNDFNISLRPSRILGLTATLETTFPSFALGFTQFYFDYLLFDRIYLTGGKKDTSWGYIRLFNDSTYYSDETALSTDLLWDSGGYVSAIMQIPLWTGTVTGVALYNGGASLDKAYMSLAGSVEMVLHRTSVNVFMRKYTTASTKGPAYGMDIKRTLFGADVYAQGLARANAWQITGIDSFSQFVVTTGMYRWWEDYDPHVGFNVEYQYAYTPSTRTSLHRIIYDAGVSRIGDAKNIKIAVIGRHNFSDNTGMVKPGVVITSLLPYADWNIGVQFDYGPSTFKITAGTTITLKLYY